MWPVLDYFSAQVSVDVIVVVAVVVIITTGTGTLIRLVLYKNNLPAKVRFKFRSHHRMACRFRRFVSPPNEHKIPGAYLLFRTEAT